MDMTQFRVDIEKLCDAADEMKASAKILWRFHNPTDEAAQVPGYLGIESVYNRYLNAFHELAKREYIVRRWLEK